MMNRLLIKRLFFAFTPVYAPYCPSFALKKHAEACFFQFRSVIAPTDFPPGSARPTDRRRSAIRVRFHNAPFMFCSWRQSDGGKYLAHGDYSPDYLSSKENFAVRAGLVDNNKLFTQEEAEQLFKCAAFARDNCESLTYDQDHSLMELMEKLQDAYPSLKENPPSFDDGESPQLNM